VQAYRVRLSHTHSGGSATILDGLDHVAFTKCVSIGRPSMFRWFYYVPSHPGPADQKPTPAGDCPPNADLHAVPILLATSGTTGEPKLVAHRQASLTPYSRKMVHREFHVGQIIAYSLELAHMPGVSHLLASLSWRHTDSSRS
jgi:acyl-coenzyme A synthetase/AMP-(fatty) acid ligase